MKKSSFVLLALLVLTSNFVLADCSLEVSMVNQDPYPAVPGDYVKILFQVSGVENPDCGDVSFDLLENYPLKFDPGFNPVQKLSAGTFSRGYNSDWIVPYTVRIDPSALDGDAEIEVLYSTGGVKTLKVSQEFNLSIEDVRADFKVFVRSYDYSTNRFVLEILNTAKNDVEAVVLEIPSQENIKILGGNKNIIGDLDSKDYTSTDFTAIPQDGKILVEIEYSDSTGERRSLEKEVVFDSSYFEHTKPSSSGTIRNLIILVVVVVLFFVWRHFRKRKKRLIK
jgi:hypothetical protein